MSKENKIDPYQKEHIYSKTTLPLKFLDIFIAFGFIVLLILLLWFSH